MTTKATKSCECLFKMGVERPKSRLTKFGWSVVESSAESEGQSLEGGIVDTPKVGCAKIGPVTAEMSGMQLMGRVIGLEQHHQAVGWVFQF